MGFGENWVLNLNNGVTLGRFLVLVESQSLLISGGNDDVASQGRWWP